MRKNALLLIVAVIAVAFSSCRMAKPLTGDVVKEYHVTFETLEKVQFYNSTEMVLKREYYVDTCTYEKGKLVTKKTLKHEKVIIPKKTCGVVKSFQGDLIEIYFGDKDKTMTFVSAKNGEYLTKSEGGKVQYGDNLFELTQGDGVSLLCKRKHIFRNEYAKTTVKGKKISR